METGFETNCRAYTSAFNRGEESVSKRTERVEKLLRAPSNTRLEAENPVL